jgi:hypothetical protein
MTEQTFAKIGTTIYQVIKDGQPAELVGSYDTALRKIGLAFTTRDDLEAWGRLGEFPGLDTIELAGTYLQRIRFAIEQTGRHCGVAEHRLKGPFETTSLVRTIDVTNEFDPGYELQSGLYRAALGSIDRDDIAERLAAVIAGKIAFERITKSDEEIVSAIIEASSRLGSETFKADAATDASAFLNELPRVAADRYEELAAKAFPQPAMSM